MVDDRTNYLLFVFFALFLRENVPVAFKFELLEDVFGDLFSHAFFVRFVGESIDVGGGFALFCIIPRGSVVVDFT